MVPCHVKERNRLIQVETEEARMLLTRTEGAERLLTETRELCDEKLRRRESAALG